MLVSTTGFLAHHTGGTHFSPLPSAFLKHTVTHPGANSSTVERTV